MKTYVNLLYIADFVLEWDVWDKHCRENQNTYYIFNNFFQKIVLFLMWKNMVYPHRPYNTVQKTCDLHTR